jgi:hypothetical protein
MPTGEMPSGFQSGTYSNSSSAARPCHMNDVNSSSKSAALATDPYMPRGEMFSEVQSGTCSASSSSARPCHMEDVDTSSTSAAQVAVSVKDDSRLGRHTEVLPHHALQQDELTRHTTRLLTIPSPVRRSMEGLEHASSSELAVPQEAQQQVVTCPHCTFECEPGDVDCMACGSSLPLSSSHWRCERCSLVNSMASTYCVACGNSASCIGTGVPMPSSTHVSHLGSPSSAVPEGANWMPRTAAPEYVDTPPQDESQVVAPVCGSGLMPTPSADLWTCHRCTFENPPLFLTCGVCGAIRIDEECSR